MAVQQARGTHFLVLTLTIWQWCPQRSIFLRAGNIPQSRILARNGQFSNRQGIERDKTITNVLQLETLNEQMHWIRIGLSWENLQTLLGV